MKKNNGYTLIEVLVAVSILFLILMVILPLITLLNTEQQSLKERLVFTSILHDELQSYLWEGKLEESSYTTNIQSIPVQFTFIMEDGLWKGCVQWENGKQKTEKTCLYGYPQ